MGDNDASLSDHNLSVILIGFGSAALVVTIYHCIAVGWCNRQHDNTSPEPPPRTFRPVVAVETLSSMENSTAQLIPAHKYKKGMGNMVGEEEEEDDDGMCAVCLSEFVEGEEVRTLPECMHLYHAPCIDMWLYSHSNCPVCRSNASPSPSPQIF